MTVCLALARGDLVSPDEAAELIGVSRNLIDVWAHRGHLERVRIGRRVWLWSDDVYDAHRRGKFAARITPL